MAVETRYETVIGIEVHAQLKTASKMFCACPTAPPPGEPDLPNTRVCPVCLGMPGTLPVINRRAVELVILTGLALGAEVQTAAVRFERKNYFYPDLPKGYQISQYALPLTANGSLRVPVAAEGTDVRVGITRAHLEEDTARLLHGGRGHTLVDFNRAGVPLMEIVTEPDIRSPAQARAYGETLRDILRYIGASDGDMETGSMRIEGNISLRPAGSDGFGTKVEVKNLNSFRSLERAMEYEVARHTEALEKGEPLVQETRGWDENSGRTVPQRTKEEANDYRYFPEPDLPPLRPSPEWVETLRQRLPELPAARRARYTDQLGLSEYDARVLTADVALADYFDAVVATGIGPKVAANWVTGEFSRLLNRHAADGLRASGVALKPEGLAELIAEVEAGRVSATNAKEVLARTFESGESPRAVIEAGGLLQVSDPGLIGREVEAVLNEFPTQVAEYRAGKQQIYGFLVGQVMKRTAGRADARLVNEELRRRLSE
ncbi:MAG TPA: Asp-tRNA(Asn)/Glu-tRNA(Gln) amidotransferase subunit GatB [candidate division Zixibacteria bacterium]|nr:Asp-tRNA(Asn)/Glu-tRNA(Gln) amidotransferase subunit GatB [candidate division Zixibacteria bacterium]